MKNTDKLLYSLLCNYDITITISPGTAQSMEILALKYEMLKLKDMVNPQIEMHFILA